MEIGQEAPKRFQVRPLLYSRDYAQNSWKRKGRLKTLVAVRSWMEGATMKEQNRWQWVLERDADG